MPRRWVQRFRGPSRPFTLFLRSLFRLAALRLALDRCCEFLIQNGADILSLDERQCSPLDIACLGNQVIFWSGRPPSSHIGLPLVLESGQARGGFARSLRPLCLVGAFLSPLLETWRTIGRTFRLYSTRLRAWQPDASMAFCCCRCCCCCSSWCLSWSCSPWSGFPVIGVFCHFFCSLFCPYPPVSRLFSLSTPAGNRDSVFCWMGTLGPLLTPCSHRLQILASPYAAGAGRGILLGQDGSLASRPARCKDGGMRGRGY